MKLIKILPIKKVKTPLIDRLVKNTLEDNERKFEITGIKVIAKEPYARNLNKKNH